MHLRVIGIIVIAGVLIMGAACVGAILAIGMTQGVSAVGEHVAVVRAHGPIVTRGTGGLFDPAVVSAEDLVEQIDRARADGNARAILLDVDSPGGGVVASQMIYDAVVRAMDDGIPVVAYFGDTAASGGYYIAAPSDHIVSRSSTITGSIGVIASIPNLEELFEKIGVDMQVVTSGERKDMLQGSRPLTDEERAILQSIIDESYEEFVQAVANGRDMPVERVREIADGRIYSGRQAFELGLVDELGDYFRAVEVAGELGGLGPDPLVVDYTPDPGFWDIVLGTRLDGFGILGPVEVDPRTLYLELRYSLQ